MYALLSWKLIVSREGRSSGKSLLETTCKVHRYYIEKWSWTKSNDSQLLQVCQIKERRVEKGGVAEPKGLNLRKIWKWVDTPSETSDWLKITVRKGLRIARKVHQRRKHWWWGRTQSYVAETTEKHVERNSLRTWLYSVLAVLVMRHIWDLPLNRKSPFSKHPFSTSSITREGRSSGDEPRGKTIQTEELGGGKGATSEVDHREISEIIDMKRKDGKAGETSKMYRKEWRKSFIKMDTRKYR